MLGLMQYPQRVLLHMQQKRLRTFLAILKYVAAQQPTDRQFRYSNRPIRCFAQLSRYYGRYHEHTRNPAIDVAADCLAAPRRNFEADSAAPWQRAPPLDHVQVTAVRAAWHES